MEEVPPTSISPTTDTGALLAEEWTINSQNVFPSFMEMILVDDASQSIRKGLQSFIHTSLVPTLQGYLLQRQDERNQQAQRQPRIGRFQNERQGSVFLSSEEEEQQQQQQQQQEHSSLRTKVKAWLRRYLLQVLRRALEWIERYGAELRFLALYSLERSFIHSNSTSTFAESLYGMKRVKVLNEDKEISQSTNPSQPKQRIRKLAELSLTDKTRLALIQAGGPYIREKLNRLFQQLNQQRSLTLSGRSFLRIYPLVGHAINALTWFCHWRYCIGQSYFYDLPSLILQQIVRRITQEDVVLPSANKKGAAFALDEQSKSDASTPPTDTGSAFALRKFAAYIATMSILVSWATQLRSEWQQRRQRRLQQERHESRITTDATASPREIGVDGGGKTLSIPPPPPQTIAPMPSVGKTGDANYLCLMCQQQRRDPVASVSGYVFCSKCLLPYVSSYGKCPRTGIPCSVDRLIRLYEPHEQRQ